MTMPRTVEEILAHADELAARFESYEPDPARELDAHAVGLLRAAVAERSDAERHMVDAVKVARDAGLSWSAIGTLVGTSGEAARQRYANKVAYYGVVSRVRQPLSDPRCGTGRPECRQ